MPAGEMPFGRLVAGGESEASLVVGEIVLQT